MKMIDETSDRLIAALLEISNLVGSVMRLEDILHRIVQTTSDLMGMPVCSIYIFDERRRLVLRSTIGLEAGLVDQVSFAAGEGIPGWVAQSGRLLAIADTSLEPRHVPVPGSSLDALCRGSICAPLRIQEEIIGVMLARSLETQFFSLKQSMLFETVCKMVAIVIEKARMYQEKTRAQELAAVAVSLSEIAHYIKNVMFTTQVAEATVNRAVAGECGLSEVVPAWHSLKDANQRIRKLVGDILSYCREESPQYEKVNLNATIRAMVATLQPQAAQGSVRLVTDLDPRIGDSYADSMAIYGALLNLLTNAIDSIPAGRAGQVRIRTELLVGQNNLRITIEDNGVGIPESNRDRIFTLFFSTKGKQGSGIGLSATKKVIEMHGGTIEFKSELGAGTTFTVHLPLRPPTVQMSL